MQQENAGPARLLEPSLQDVDAEVIDVFHEARAYAGRQYRSIQWRQIAHVHVP